MREARHGHTATLLADGKVLVVGGNGGANGRNAMDSAELYDPADGSWTAALNLIGGRADHTATLLADGTVLVAGGGGGLQYRALASAELYDPVTGSWSAAGTMITARKDATATLLADGRVLIVGGDVASGDPMAAAEFGS